MNLRNGTGEEEDGKPYVTRVTIILFEITFLQVPKGDVERDDWQRRFLAQHSIATVTLFRMVTALQRCVVLKIVVANRPVQHHL